MWTPKVLFSRPSPVVASPVVQMASDLPTPPRRPAAARKPVVVEIGATGSVMSAGQLLDQDYNTDLRGPQVYQTWDKMRKSDGQVRAALRVIKLPIGRAQWLIEPASDSSEDTKIAEWLEDYLFNRMTITWSNLLRQILLMLDFGAMPFEKVWNIEDGLVVLRKLAPRMPATITEWQVDHTGGLKGIKQNASRGMGFAGEVEIPVDKLLVFTNELEGSDYKGMSLLRAAYKHWYYKDKLYVIDAIAKERRAVGVDVGKLEGPDVDDDDRVYLENALMGLHAHENQFMVEQEGRFSYRIEGTQGTLISSMDSIEHHDLRILRSVLAEFLAMGEGATGSLAMHKDKSSFFIMALEEVCENICDTFNRYLIPQWVDFNWSVKKGYPKLIYSKLDTRDVQAIASAISDFVTSKTLTPGPDIEEYVRNVMDLPEMPDEVANPPEPAPAPAPEPNPADNTGEPPATDGLTEPVAAAITNNYNHPTPLRTFAFAKTVNFAEINDLMDSGEDKIFKAVKAVQQRQIDKIAEVAASLAAKGDLNALGELTVPYKRELAGEIAAVLNDLFIKGRSQVAKELKMELEEPGPAKNYLLARALGAVNILADRLKSSAIWSALEIFRNKDGDVDPKEAEKQIKDNLKDLSDREIKRAAQNTVSEAVNLGRDSAAREGKAKATYSAVLDHHTCSHCQAVDGITVEVGSSDYERLKPPFRDCLGHSKCRCIFIYTTA